MDIEMRDNAGTSKLDDRWLMFQSNVKESGMKRLSYDESANSKRPAVTKVRSENGDLGKPIFYTDVVVIGNGPSALSLSAFLSGCHPYYDGVTEHPNSILHEKLVASCSKSLMDQDLAYLCEGLEGRSTHPVSLLYDQLVRPDADLGQENPSTLAWRREDSSHIPHVVLGKGPIGGTWADLSPDVMTLSFASWLDLPAYSFRDWLDKDGANFATDLQMKIDATRSIVGRVPCTAIGRYYQDYVRKLELEENIFEHTLVTSVRKRCRDEDDQDEEYAWDVHACHSGRAVHFRCRYVVLATGVTVPRYLGIPGEDDPRVVHSIAQLDEIIEKLGNNRNEQSNQIDLNRINPVLIVGDGLSAADAIIRCLINGIPVIHSFRKRPKDSQQILSKLSKVVYPEYHTVFQLMIGATNDPLYTVHPRTQINQVQFDLIQQDQIGGGSAYLQDLKNECIRQVGFSCAAVLIGFEADLGFLRIDDGSEMSKFMVDPVTCQSLDEQDLYALGPLIGDNYVRYVIGGSMAAAADIVRKINT